MMKVQLVHFAVIKITWNNNNYYLAFSNGMELIGKFINYIITKKDNTGKPF